MLSSMERWWIVLSPKKETVQQQQNSREMTESTRVNLSFVGRRKPTFTIITRFLCLLSDVVVLHVRATWYLMSSQSGQQLGHYSLPAGRVTVDFTSAAKTSLRHNSQHWRK